MEQLLAVTPVAWGIFIITIGISLLAFSNESLYGTLMLHPYSIYRGSKTYTIITSGFIHKDWTHLFFNMWSFFIFAPALESRLGHWQFGLLYMVSLALSDLPTIFKHKDDYWYHSLGASGAISAVLFSYILFEPFSKLGIFPIPFGIPACLFGGLYLVYCVYASKQARDAINHDAHFFGALSGVMITIILYPSVISQLVHQF